MLEFVRKNIIGLKPYIAGKPIEETKREFRLKQVVKLASNENPIGPSPKAKVAIRKALSGLNRYPDSQGYCLKKRLARMLRVQDSNIVLGNGSDELIDVIIKTFVEDDQNIVTADVTFLEYAIISRVNDRRVITAPLRYFKFDLEAIRSKIDAKTKLVFIANPNNPTGTYVGKVELKEFLGSIPKSVLVVLDQAYDAFIDVDDFPLNLDFRRYNNLIVLKTFSKAFGLAGLRIGYCIARPEFVNFMERVRQPFNVNSLAQKAALAALDDKAFLKKTRRVILKGKSYLYQRLASLGVSYVPSVANFILVDVGRDSREVFKEMLKGGVIVRDMRQYRLKNFIRVTIGTKKENRKLIKVLKSVLLKK
ncbi:histidinol-phosphate transaminase [Candidatus Omnitrophota bacterium]